MIKFIVLTIFKSSFDSFLNTSIIKRAIDKNILDVKLVDIRDYTLNKNKNVDDKPYGASGMIMSVEPIDRALLDVIKDIDNYKIIYMSPRGKLLNYNICKEFATNTDTTYIVICGHYEGIDNRIFDLYDIEEISIGDYVLTGGEIASQVFIDSITRLVDNVINKESLVNESHTNKLLEYPQYTKPEIYKNLKVPKILLSGHHLNIEKYNKEKSIEITKLNRPDLLNNIKEDI
ncbi:MAG: tRNA (guanosine(37)-N1)-methyltransferase TrmD [Clostridia bacterium]